MKTTSIALLLSLTFSLTALAADLPDPSITPGAIDSSVNQSNIQQTVCVKGYTKTVRPPQYFTNKLKKSQIRDYGYADTNPKDYEEDHLIPLNIGGAPDNPDNLWPQPRNSQWNSEKKDVLEYKLYKLVCQGDVPLDVARKEMATNWIQAYKKYVGNN